MRINEVTPKQLFLLLLALEHVPCHISYLTGKAGMCPWCGRIGVHHEECNLNTALMLFILAEESNAKSDMRFATLLAIQVLEELKLISSSGLMFFKLEDYLKE